MSTRRISGTFWDAIVVPANGFSHVTRTGWGYDNFSIYLDVSAATTITLLAAPQEPLSSEGINPDQASYEAATSEFMPLWYLDIELKWVFAGAAKRSILIPDFAPQYARLQSSGTNITITAKWLASGD